jgi:hypothetical protein
MVEQRLAYLEKGKLMTRSRIYLTVIIALLVGLACAMPEIPMDVDTFNTAVAETVMVGLTQKYVSPTITPSPTITLTPTLTPKVPTLTITSTGTITPTSPFTPTASATPQIPLPKIVVTVNTNCRTGPDKSFRVEGTLLKGESTTVHGIDPTGLYWYILNPDPGLEYCWLSGKYATVVGDKSFLSVMTAQPTPTATLPPTPTPKFKLIYSGLETCGKWWVDLELVNTGAAPFLSVLITVKDSSKGNTYQTGGNGFVNMDACNTTTTVVDVLEPGTSVIVSSPPFNFDPTGKKLIVTVSVCTEPEGSAGCLTQTITFKPK